MKKLGYLLLVTILSISLSACTTTKEKSGKKVRCPACGYEFIPDDSGS